MPQLMSRTPQWLLQPTIMIIKMFARVYFGSSTIYKMWCDEVSYCSLFHLLLCNGRCLFLLMGISRKLIQPHTSSVDIALFSSVEAILRG